METRRDWNGQDFTTAQNVWRRGASMDDDDRRALERAAVRYFYKACGIDRQGACISGGTTHAPCPTKRGHGLEAPRARFE